MILVFAPVLCYAMLRHLGLLDIRGLSLRGGIKYGVSILYIGPVGRNGTLLHNTGIIHNSCHSFNIRGLVEKKNRKKNSIPAAKN